MIPLLTYRKLKPAYIILLWLTKYPKTLQRRQNGAVIPNMIKTFTFARLSTIDSKLLAFKSKPINRLINYRVNLFRWYIVNDPNVTLCEVGRIDYTYHAIMKCNWTFDKRKIIVENLDPSRSRANFIDNKKWVFGTCDTAINLIILIIISYMCRVRSGNKDLKNACIYWQKKTYLPDVRFNREWLNFTPLVDDGVQFGSKNAIYINWHYVRWHGIKGLMLRCKHYPQFCQETAE